MTNILSSNTVLYPIKDTDNYYIINFLTGNADIVTKQEAEAIENGVYDKEMLKEKGYIMSSEEEKILVTKRYLDFIDSRETDEVQLFFVPWYDCNFTCSYCYQDQYNINGLLPTKELIDAFFLYIEKEFKKRRTYITMFGGEPLLLGAKHKEVVTYLLQQATHREIDVAIVTNGFTVKDYISILTSSQIREIQITLDGTETVHNARRFSNGNRGTFKEIVEGIDLLLQKSIPVNLRMVVDKENINDLPDFAQFCIDKGWTSNINFKTQIGRNYELHHCQSTTSKLFTRLELYSELYNLIKQHPHILEFHKPAFSIAKFLFEQGELPEPLFDSCPGTKTEWAFDSSGNIYSCTATVGKKGEELGTFYPTITKNTEIIQQWQNRDVLSIPECKQCSLRLACGGGCGSLAKNYNGSIISPNCRPVKELISLGIRIYFRE
ncbi:MAG: radical SAM protein [Bacteroidales bacterium]